MLVITRWFGCLFWCSSLSIPGVLVGLCISVAACPLERNAFMYVVPSVAGHVRILCQNQFAQLAQLTKNGLWTPTSPHHSWHFPASFNLQKKNKTTSHCTFPCPCGAMLWWIFISPALAIPGVAPAEEARYHGQIFACQEGPLGLQLLRVGESRIWGPKVICWGGTFRTEINRISFQPSEFHVALVGTLKT